MSGNVRPLWRAMAALCLALIACDESGTGPDVSDTEIWRLELEQTDDGSTQADIARRRGTISVMLRLNHTTQPDPACADAALRNVTTFLATVEVPASRLQGATVGTASGSWNCFGFSGEVRLDDGTTYTLTSESFAFEPAASIQLQTPMSGNRWASQLRRGHFLLAPEERFEYEPFDSHLDVRVDNRHDDDVEVTFYGIDTELRWVHHDLEYDYDVFPELDRAASVPPRQSRIITFPAQPVPGSASESPPPFRYGIYATTTVELHPLTYGFSCVLGPERRNEVELIIHAPEDFECGTGWLGMSAIFLDPRRLFLRPGQTDTVAVNAYSIINLGVSSSEPGIVPTVIIFSELTDGTRATGRFAVYAAPDAPKTEYSVLVRGEVQDFDVEEEVVEVLPVEVYDLSVTLSRDTVRIPAGTSSVVDVRLERDGLIGLDLALDIPTLPAGVFVVPPTFSPTVVERDSSRLTLQIDDAADPGAHPLTICARIDGDPRERCHQATLVLEVTEPLPPYDLMIATTPSNDVMARGQEVFFNVLVSSLGGTVSTGVAATERLPEGFTYLRHEQSAGNYDPARGIWTIGTVNAGPPTTLRVYARADSVGEFRNIAWLAAGIDGDNNPQNDVDTATVEVVEPTYDLEVTKTVDRDTVAAGDTVQFRLRAINHGPAVPIGAAVREPLPAGLDYVSDDGAGAYGEAIGLWSLGTLPPGTERILHIRAIARATATNTATILSESARDGNRANDVAEVTVVVSAGS